MRKGIRKPNMGGLLALLLFGVFTACVLSVLLMGADAYQRLVHRDLTGYDRRTAIQYISTRVRQGGRLGAVSVRAFEGHDALVITEDIQGVSYETRVYCHEGWLRELFSVAGGGAAPEDGEKILAVQDFEAGLDPVSGLLSLRVRNPDGSWSSALLHPRSGGEALS